MKLKYKLLALFIAICYTTFLFGCDSKKDFSPYADGTYTAEDEHHHHHDDEDEEEEHEHEHEVEDHDHNHHDEE